MNIIKKSLGILSLTTLLINVSWAWDFLYVEQTLEYSKMTEITPLDLSGQGTIQFEHECDYCPDTLTYNLDTRLTTPFGEDQDIYQLTQWLSHNVMVQYSTTSPVALRIHVYSASNN